MQAVSNPQTVIDSLEFRYSKYASSLSSQLCLLEQTILLRFSNPQYVLLCLAIILRVTVRSRVVQEYVNNLENPLIEFPSFYVMWE